MECHTCSNCIFWWQPSWKFISTDSVHTNPSNIHGMLGYDHFHVFHRRILKHFSIGSHFKLSCSGGHFGFQIHEIKWYRHIQRRSIFCLGLIGSVFCFKMRTCTCLKFSIGSNVKLQKCISCVNASLNISPTGTSTLSVVSIHTMVLENIIECGVNRCTVMTIVHMTFGSDDNSSHDLCSEENSTHDLWLR